MEIHRSRFVPYPPSAINALAFSHSGKGIQSAEDPSTLRLAIGRANGNIEIWNPRKGTWVQEKTFCGGKERSVEGLIWIQELEEVDGNGKLLPGKLRLFSIGYSDSVTEWNLVTGLPARHSGGNHSQVWCVAAQPQYRAPKKRKSGNAPPRDDGEFKGQNLAVGCADGALAIISTAEDDLRFQKFLARPTSQKARVLSITYQDRVRVIAGYGDSTIRVFNSQSGETIRSITLGAGPKGGPKEILVWKIRCLPNRDIVSADSSGELRVFDGNNYSQVQRLAAHDADILDLVVSKDGKQIFTGGLDRRTAVFKFLRTKGDRGSWVKVSHSKFHEHDVRALATYDGKRLSVTVSGGIDSQPIVVPTREFGKEFSRALPFLPQTPPLATAPSERLLVSWWNCEIRIWRIPSSTGNEQRHKLLAKMAVQGDENITSAAITQDGSILAVATVAEVKLFQLVTQITANGATFSISKIQPTTPLPGARLVQFSRNGKWLAIITYLQTVHLARLLPADENTPRCSVLPQLITLQRLSRTSDPDTLNGSWGNYYRTITHAGFSDDSAVLAVGDLGGFIDAWAVEGNEDPTAAAVDVANVLSSASSSEDGEDSDNDADEKSQPITIMGQHWRRHPNAQLIPKLDSPPLVLSFRPASATSRPQPNGNPAVHATRHNPHPHSHELPNGEQRLVIVTATHGVCELDLLQGGFSDWSKRNPTSHFPILFTGTKDRTKGCVWDIDSGKERLWLYGVNWLFMIDLAKDLPEPELIPPTSGANEASIPSHDLSKKRKRSAGEERPKKKSSGAGDAILDHPKVVSSVRKFAGGESDESKWINLDDSRTPDSDEDMDNTRLTLATARRTARAGAESGASNDEDVKMADGVENQAGEDHSGDKAVLRQRGKKNKAVKARGWWHTFKYRPILGIVPIGERSGPLEVVLVERPSWDLDLPPRFVGPHERSV